MTDWMERAACRGVDTRVFFPAGEDVHLQLAQRHCAICTVRAQCLDAALDMDEQGVWGGMTERQRQLYQRDARPRRLGMREYDCECMECGRRFVSRYMHAKTCCDTCRQRVYRRRLEEAS